MVALPPRGGVASLWGCGLLGITSCSSSLTPYCWDHFISIFIQLTNTLEQLLCVKDCSRYERYGRHQDLKVIPFTDLTLEGEKLGFHPPPPRVVPLPGHVCAGHSLHQYLFPWWSWSFPRDQGFWPSLSLYQKSGKKKSTQQTLFFFRNEPTNLFQVSYVVQQDIYHLSLKHLPLGHSICSELPQEEYFHFFPAWETLL